MKLSKFFIIPMFLTNCIYGMTSEQMLKKHDEVKPKLEQLKNALFNKATSDTIKQLLAEMNQLSSYDRLGMWQQIFRDQKASLIGNAESAARVVDLQVQQMVRKNQPVPAALQEQHANARTNLHLIKDWLYSYEDTLKKMSRGWRS